MNLAPDANAPEPASPGIVLIAGQPVGGGRYVLKKFLGQGGMGVVWLAWDERLQLHVALKFLPAHIQSDPVALDDMRRETARSIRLAHPNIIRIHDLHEIQGREAFISMEYIEGSTLHALRVQQPNRVFSWSFLQPLVKQLCAAMDYAHDERVIHRDLKPANMMLDARGRLKLADFGIAAVVSESLSRISLKRPTSGTPTHMSPQQMNGQAPRVTDDIYSLGASLYELLTSRPPFYMGEIAHQVLDVPATPMADRLAELELTNEIPPDVAAMVMACLAKEPAQRPQSARAVADWIGLSLDTDSKLRSVPEAKSASASALAGLVQKWRPLGWGAAALALLGALGLYWAISPGARQSNAGAATVPNTKPETSLAAGTRPASAKGPSESSSVSSSESAEGFVSLFNGHDLSGWEELRIEDFDKWSVKDGAMTGVTKSGGTHVAAAIFWRGGLVDDFELRFSYKLGHMISYKQGGCAVIYRDTRSNSGLPKGLTNSYEMYLGGPLMRDPGGKLAEISQNVIATDRDGQESLSVVGSLGNPAVLSTTAKDADWNDCAIIVQGHHHIYKVNGRTMIEFRDENAAKRTSRGEMQLFLWNGEGFPPLPVQFKNIRLKRFPLQTNPQGLLLTTRDPATPARCIDLTDYYNVLLTDSWHFGTGQSDLSEVPSGVHKFGDVEFDVRGLIQVGAASRAAKKYPEQISGIKLDRTCRFLHFLHAAIHAANVDGPQIGSYVVHYANGSQREIPIRLGEEVADWFTPPNEERRHFIIAWQGYNAESRRQGRRIRLFTTRWQNPMPDTPITSIDFTHKPSATNEWGGTAAPFLVALTTGG